MHAGAAELFRCDYLVRHGLHHVGAGNEHVGGVLDHEDEIRDRRRVDGTAGTGSHDQADLGDHAGGQHVSLKDLRIAAEGGNTFLNAGSAGIVHADHRCAYFHGLIHHLADLLGVGFRERAAEYGEILAEDEDQTPVDGAVTRDHAIGGNLLLRHAEFRAPVFDEFVPFFEGVLIQQKADALPGGQLALEMLLLNAMLAAAELCGLAGRFQPLDDFPLHRPLIRLVILEDDGAYVVGLRAATLVESATPKTRTPDDAPYCPQRPHSLCRPDIDRMYRDVLHPCE